MLLCVSRKERWFEGEPIGFLDRGKGGAGKESGILGELLADVHLSGTAPTVEGDRAERDFFGSVDGERSIEHQGGEAEEHDREDRRDAPRSDARQKQYSAVDFEPRQSGGDQVEQKRLFGELEFAELFEKRRGVGRLDPPEIDEHKRDRDTRKKHEAVAHRDGGAGAWV